MRTRWVPVIGLLVVAACSGNTKHDSASTRIESVETYAERVLPQTFQADVGDNDIAEVKVCISAHAKSRQTVRAGDFTLVIPHREPATASVGVISPILRDTRLDPGDCAHGFVNWNEPADQHPTIVDQRTGATWKPDCAKTTTSTVPCHVVPKRVA